MANDFNAFKPVNLSSLMQDPLHKSLVGEGLCSTRLTSDLVYGESVRISRRNALAASDYVDAEGVTIQDADPTEDTLTIGINKVTGFDVSKQDRIQNKLSAATEYTDEAVYSLKDALDTEIIADMKTSAGSVQTSILLGDDTIIPAFTAAGVALRSKNVVNNGDWFALLDPLAFGHLQSKLTNIGFNTADAVISNGRVGEALDFQVFISNNLPAGNILFGKLGATDLVVQDAPSIDEYQRQVGEGIASYAGNTQLGKRFIADILAGVKTTAAGEEMLVAQPYTTT